MSAAELCRVDTLTLDCGDGILLQGFKLRPSEEKKPSRSAPAKGASALLLHGYGGCKEEILGVAFAVMAATPMEMIVPDLPGHGSSTGEFSWRDVLQAMTVLDHSIKPDIAIGHSIGGRLAASLTGAPSVCAISAPLRADFPGDRKEMLKTLRQKRVQEASAFAGLNELLFHLGEEPLDRKLPGAEGRPRNVLLIRAVNDLETVRDLDDRCKNIEGVTIAAPVKGATHLDILTAKQLMSAVSEWSAESFAAAGAARRTDGA